MATPHTSALLGGAGWGLGGAGRGLGGAGWWLGGAGSSWYRLRLQGGAVSEATPSNKQRRARSAQRTGPNVSSLIVPRHKTD